ncbi:MAG: glycosyltransferase [Candidatus Eisenbacteria bacterium]|uniref:Glycosyltransferase n=1 Tax=Eiseniibacteriota bacterium TaxID=2212470 RepID=A0A933SI93_UNCEI|nr:glycosyltransferase [Candidatus Eisenbacteria bacterium]
MKIATLSNASVVHTLRWVEHLRSRGHDVRVWSLERGPESLGARALPEPPLPGFVRYPLATLPLLRELREFAPEVIDAHYVPNYGLIGALSGFRPLSVAAWGSDLLIAGKRDALQRLRARFVLRRADLVIADSGNLAAAALALGAPKRTLRAIPWGVDRERFAPAAEREAGLLLSTRMHESVYDIPALLRGVAPVMARRPDTRLVIAGDGSLLEAHRALAAELLPAGRYEFTGRITPAELARLLSRAEVYLSASLSDSTSLSLLEAMSAGALPVVSDIEGNREWVADGDGARLFPCGDAAAVERAVDAALGDAAWARRARARNAAVIAERGDWHRNFARIEQAFAALAAGRPLPPDPGAFA